MEGNRNARSQGGLGLISRSPLNFLRVSTFIADPVYIILQREGGVRTKCEKICTTELKSYPKCSLTNFLHLYLISLSLQPKHGGRAEGFATRRPSKPVKSNTFLKAPQKVIRVSKCRKLSPFLISG